HVLHSFPTRRSSDLMPVNVRFVRVCPSAGHIGIATQSCVLSLCSFFQWGMKFHFMSVYVFPFLPKAKRKKGSSISHALSSIHCSYYYRSEEHTSELQSRFD